MLHGCHGLRGCGRLPWLSAEGYELRGLFVLCSGARVEGLTPATKACLDKIKAAEESKQKTYR